MTSTWVPTTTRGGSEHRLLACVEGLDGLHVVLESPPRLVEPLASASGPPYLFPELAVTSDEGWQPEDGFISMGTANVAMRSFDRTLIYARYPTTPPPQVASLTVDLRDPDSHLLHSTVLRRRSTPSPDSWAAGGPDHRDGYRFLAAAEGEQVFYVICEGPYDGSAFHSPNLDDDALTYRLILDGVDHTPRYNTVHPARSGGPEATRAVLLIMIARPEHSPTALILTITDPVTGRAVYHLEAERYR